MTIDEFIAVGKQHGRANLYIDVPGFESFYARFGQRVLGNIVYHNVLDIANITVEEHLRGTGVFTRLVTKLRIDHPTVHLYVENAAPRFQRLLHRLGFRPHEAHQDSFYLLNK